MLPWAGNRRTSPLPKYLTGIPRLARGWQDKARGTMTECSTSESAYGKPGALQSRASCLAVASRCFAFAAARHQFMDGFTRSFALAEDGVHLLGDGHFHSAGTRQADRRGGGENSFCDCAVHACDNFSELASAAEFHAHAAVARQASGAGENQIAQAGEACHGFSASATGHDQARHFSQAPRDQ